MIKKPKIVLIIASIAIFFAFGLTASAAIEIKQLMHDENVMGEWELNTSTEQVDIFQKKVWVKDPSSDIRKEILIFKMVNKTDDKIRVEWYLKTYYGNLCRSCNLDRPNEYDKSITLSPNQELIGDEHQVDQILAILSKLDIEKFRALDKVEFDDLKISILD